MRRIGIESLTDPVFGLTLSVGALMLTLQDHSGTQDVLNNMFRSIFSLLILVSAWLNCSYFMSRITVQRPVGLMLNLVLLLCVSLEPFLLDVMVDDQNVEEVLELASALYAFIPGTIMVCLDQMQQRSMSHRRKAGDLQGAEQDRGIRNGRFLYSAAFFHTALPVFWDPYLGGYPLRFLIWWASPMIWTANVALDLAGARMA